MAKDFIPVAGEQRSGVEQTAYYAQMIIKAFQDAMDKNNCLSKIPVAIGLEISQTIDDLKDTKEVLAGIGGITPPLAPVDPDRQVLVTSPDETPTQIPYSQSQQNYGVSNKNVLRDLAQFAEDCFNCDLDMDMIGLFKNLISGIKQQIKFAIDKLKGLKDLLDFDLTSNFDGLLDIGNIFQNMCIKDLNMISALLLSALLDFNADINIGGLGDFSFQFGVMSQLMSVIFNAIKDIINFAMKPVNCAITALETIAESIPSERNIAKRLGAQKTTQLKNLTGVDLESAEESQMQTSIRNIVSKIREHQQGVSEEVFAAQKATEGMIKRTNDAIQTSVSQIDKKYQDLVGISKYMTCESMRSGSTRGAVEGGLPSIAQDVKLMAGLVNLIRSIIKKKIRKSLRDQGYNSGVSTYTPVQSQPLELSQVDVADAIADAFEASAKVTNTPNGNLQVLFTKKTPSNIANKLNLKICNTEDFMKGNHIQDIIKEVLDEVQRDATTGSKTPPNAGAGGIVSTETKNEGATQIDQITTGAQVVLVVPAYSALIKETFNILKAKTDNPSVKASTVQKATVIKCATNQDIMERFALISKRQK